MNLDTFETQLLEELRAHVTARATAQESEKLQIHRRRRRNLVLACVAAAAAVAIAIVIPGRASPAYAVTDGPNGTIDLQVSRLEDAAGLQQTWQNTALVQRCSTWAATCGADRGGSSRLHPHRTVQRSSRSVTESQCTSTSGTSSLATHL